MSVKPDFNHYTHAELLDALQHIDAQRYPERVEIIEQQITLRESQGDIQREIKRSERYWRFKQKIKGWTFSRWMSKTFIGRFYRYLTQHHWGANQSNNNINNGVSQ